MRILIATDGSPSSHAAIQEVTARPWPPNTEVKVLSVAHPFPFVPEPVGIGIHFESLAQERKHASKAVSAAVQEIAERAPQLSTASEVLEGAPAKGIVEEAKRWRANLIVLGSKGRGAVASFLLGSVSLKVVLHAPCSVHVVRTTERESDDPHGSDSTSQPSGS
jgi:nucleotide-binding universal stress UspA family protein